MRRGSFFTYDALLSAFIIMLAVSAALHLSSPRPSPLSDARLIRGAYDILYALDREDALGCRTADEGLLSRLTPDHLAIQITIEGVATVNGSLVSFCRHSIGDLPPGDAFSIRGMHQGMDGNLYGIRARAGLR